MTGYQTKLESYTFSNTSLDILSLKDKTQFYDPDKEAEKLGISSTLWPISGLIWPAGVVLAKIVNEMDLNQLRILEVGCGIGIASLVAAHKKADITASDYHPITETLLKNNIEGNNLNPVKYLFADWNHPITNAGYFDLIIGSDLLYETQYSDILSRFIDCHLNPKGQVILIDPGRRTAKKIKKAMDDYGFEITVDKVNAEGEIKKGGYFTKYVFKRSE